MPPRLAFDEDPKIIRNRLDSFFRKKKNCQYFLKEIKFYSFFAVKLYDILLQQEMTIDFPNMRMRERSQLIVGSFIPLLQTRGEPHLFHSIMSVLVLVSLDNVIMPHDHEYLKFVKFKTKNSEIPGL